MAGEQESRLLVLGLRSYIRLSEKRLVGNIFSVKDACTPLLVLRFRSALLPFFIPPRDSFIRVIRPRYLLLRKAKSQRFHFTTINLSRKAGINIDVVSCFHSYFPLSSIDDAFTVVPLQISSATLHRLLQSISNDPRKRERVV